MRNALVMALALFLFGSVGMGATTFNFDDISTGGKFTLLPTNYGGWNWTCPAPSEQWEVIDNAYYKKTYGNTYDAPSLQNAVYNDTGAATMVLSDGGLFDLESLYVSGFAQGNIAVSFTSTSLTLRGYVNNVLVGTASTALPTNSYLFWQPVLPYVDKVEFVASAAGKWWLADNITVNPVPEPFTMVSGFLAICGLGAYVRRQMRAKAAA